VESAELRDRYVGLLFDRIKECRYPSAPMLDRVEGAIRDRETATAYLQLLMDTVDQDNYPSPQMLDRIARLLEYV
jgi:hypothetical protein